MTLSGLFLESGALLSRLYSAYDIQYDPAEFTILPAPMILAAEDAEMEQGNALPKLEARPLLPLQNGDTRLVYSLSTSASGSTPGEYPILVEPGQNPNYTIETQSGTLYVKEEAFLPGVSGPVGESSAPSSPPAGPNPDALPSASPELDAAQEDAERPNQAETQQAGPVLPLPRQPLESGGETQATAAAPLAGETGLPAQREMALQEASLAENKLPLAALELGGDNGSGWSLLGLLAAALSFLFSVFSVVPLLKWPAQKQKSALRFLAGLLPVAAGILAPVLFWLGQNLSGPMVLLNAAALPVLLLLGGQLLLVFLLRRKAQLPNKKEAA